jgi:hypothetical protein
MAVDKKNPDAAYELGRIFEEGGFKVVKDVGKAIHWYELATEWGHEYADGALAGLTTVPANQCLAVRRSHDIRENIAVINNCNHVITVKICKESKTDLLMQALGSWVSNGDCEYFEGAKGKVTEFFFAAPESADILKLLSDAKFEVSATRQLP